MKRLTHKRKLAFERLEHKCAPSTLLLAIAPLDDDFHAAVEESREKDAAVELVCPTSDVSANWQFQISTSDLLRFVDRNTQSGSAENRIAVKPSAEHCHSADEMMKLGDQDLRALVIADALHAG